MRSEREKHKIEEEGIFAMLCGGDEIPEERWIAHFCRRELDVKGWKAEGGRGRKKRRQPQWNGKQE